MHVELLKNDSTYLSWLRLWLVTTFLVNFETPQNFTKNQYNIKNILKVFHEVKLS